MERLHETFLAKNFIGEDWSINNWNKRQYVSDLSTDRVRKFRANKDKKRYETLQKQDETQNETDQNRAEQSRTEKRLELSLLSVAPTPSPSPAHFFDAWNRLADNLPKVEKLTDSRRKKVLARMRQGISQAQFEAAVTACTQKPFLRGENERGWTATFDWLVANDRNIEKAVCEYNGGGKQTATQEYSTEGWE
ncbi:MAG TPA: hypothetical protein VFB43_14870 [Terracidiphilus sp.]|nr:hypothetical protein [Terracidiphilus sp.]